ncbi:DUF1501 domain-containing protein [Fulvivirgaceae bacterium PWU4]|uniref:DUF1501 domain-containing protein n=1 Tax=Chryseosolibacter histidini TaxID=2782349 RepID=A0AAP2GIZ7_9BACT|nr:DUF1501 domain-containing protein [Chryseosolibacter histidini]MBT1697806.1 DUF1501 domain-containing protein [Chryseosolibacter histidini]
MNRSRRKFLKNIPGMLGAMSIPFSVAGVPVNLMGENAFTRMARASLGNDRVLIILQMHGGNDGLNCLIPVSEYELYYSKRANIAIPAKNSLRKYIPLDSTLAPDTQVGLHPDMQAMKAMYDQGRVTMVQGVSYKNNNGSHFRGRDIQFMGGAADEYLQSGWVGRYLEGEIAPKKYPEDFPNAEMPDPLAIEMGSDVSLIFHQEGNIPTSISLDSPQEFADLVGGLEGFIDEAVDPRGIPPGYLEDSPYYNELEWILSLEDKSKDYAARLAEVFQAGSKIAGNKNYPQTYPFNAPKGSLHNPLSWQLDIIARLLSGGCKTKVFLVKIGGFDTHADQVESYDPTMGSHAALMYHISTAMSAFQEDLRIRGLEDRVMTITTSEFGRRIYSNGSYGTDHGTGGPMFIFGKGVKPGVVGKVPDMTKGNVEMQFDHRLIYGNIVKDWFMVNETKLNDVFPGLTSAAGTSDGVKFQQLPLVSEVITGTDDFIGERFSLEECHPNPAKEKTTVRFRINSANHVSINLFDKQGRQVGVWVNDTYAPGEHKVDVDVTNLPAGNYIYQLKSGFFKDSKKLVITK